MQEQGEFDRRLREWVQPGADVVERVKRAALEKRSRPRRLVVAAVALGLAGLVMALAFPLRRTPSGAGTPFSIETSGSTVVVRAENKIWVLASQPGEAREDADYFILEGKQP
jgi:multisubunit Na+/H+ antiporter MnhB subunit